MISTSLDGRNWRWKEKDKEARQIMQTVDNSTLIKECEPYKIEISGIWSSSDLFWLIQDRKLHTSLKETSLKEMSLWHTPKNKQ